MGKLNSGITRRRFKKTLASAVRSTVNLSLKLSLTLSIAGAPVVTWSSSGFAQQDTKQGASLETSNDPSLILYNSSYTKGIKHNSVVGLVELDQNGEIPALLLRAAELRSKGQQAEFLAVIDAVEQRLKGEGFSDSKANRIRALLEQSKTNQLSDAKVPPVDPSDDDPIPTPTKPIPQVPDTGGKVIGPGQAPTGPTGPTTGQPPVTIFPNTGNPIGIPIGQSNGPVVSPVTGLPVANNPQAQIAALEKMMMENPDLRQILWEMALARMGAMGSGLPVATTPDDVTLNDFNDQSNNPILRALAVMGLGTLDFSQEIMAKKRRYEGLDLDSLGEEIIQDAAVGTGLLGVAQGTLFIKGGDYLAFYGTNGFATVLNLNMIAKLATLYGVPVRNSDKALWGILFLGISQGVLGGLKIDDLSTKTNVPGPSGAALGTDPGQAPAKKQLSEFFARAAMRDDTGSFLSKALRKVTGLPFFTSSAAKLGMAKALQEARELSAEGEFKITGVKPEVNSAGKSAADLAGNSPTKPSEATENHATPKDTANSSSHATTTQALVATAAPADGSHNLANGSIFPPPNVPPGIQVTPVGMGSGGASGPPGGITGLPGGSVPPTTGGPTGGNPTGPVVVPPVTGGPGTTGPVITQVDPNQPVSEVILKKLRDFYSVFEKSTWMSRTITKLGAAKWAALPAVGAVEASATYGAGKTAQYFFRGIYENELQLHERDFRAFLSTPQGELFLKVLVFAVSVERGARATPIAVDKPSALKDDGQVQFIMNLARAAHICSKADEQLIHDVQSGAHKLIGPEEKFYPNLAANCQNRPNHQAFERLQQEFATFSAIPEADLKDLKVESPYRRLRMAEMILELQSLKGDRGRNDLKFFKEYVEKYLDLSSNAFSTYLDRYSAHIKENEMRVDAESLTGWSIYSRNSNYNYSRSGVLQPDMNFALKSYYIEWAALHTVSTNGIGPTQFPLAPGSGSVPSTTMPPGSVGVPGQPGTQPVFPGTGTAPGTGTGSPAPQPGGQTPGPQVIPIGQQPAVRH